MSCSSIRNFTLMLSLRALLLGHAHAKLRGRSSSSKASITLWGDVGRQYITRSMVIADNCHAKTLSDLEEEDRP